MNHNQHQCINRGSDECIIANNTIKYQPFRYKSLLIVIFFFFLVTKEIDVKEFFKLDPRILVYDLFYIPLKSLTCYTITILQLQIISPVKLFHLSNHFTCQIISNCDAIRIPHSPSTINGVSLSSVLLMITS